MMTGGKIEDMYYHAEVFFVFTKHSVTKILWFSFSNFFCKLLHLQFLLHLVGYSHFFECSYELCVNHTQFQVTFCSISFSIQERQLFLASQKLYLYYTAKANNFISYVKLFTISSSVHNNVRCFTCDRMNFYKLYFDPRKQMENKFNHQWN